MNVGELLLISLVLAVDAATYSFSYGLTCRRGQRLAASLLLAGVVGLYQAGMPLLGYMGGLGLREALAQWGSWTVCGIFCALGVSVIYKAWRAESGEQEDVLLPGFWGLMLVGIATSLDAFAVGICMAVGSVLGENLSAAQLAIAVGVIGLVTFICSLACFHLSRIFHHLPERVLQILAGCLLIALGMKELI